MKIFTAACISLVLNGNYVFAGAGSSQPVPEEQNSRTSKATTPKTFLESPEAKNIATGVAVVAAAALAYKLYKSLDSEDEHPYIPEKNNVTKDKAEVDIAAFKQSIGTQPLIDLSNYDDGWTNESARIDLHPVYKNNPRKHLRQQIFELQRNYYQGRSTENKVHIITGTGIKRPGPNYTLQNNVQEWLAEDYIQKRIVQYWQPRDGIFTVMLKKEMIR